MTVEEADLKQMSKVNWLRLGDSNTMFFSLSIKLGELGIPH